MTNTVQAMGSRPNSPPPSKGKSEDGAITQDVVHSSPMNARHSCAMQEDYKAVKHSEL